MKVVKTYLILDYNLHKTGVDRNIYEMVEKVVFLCFYHGLGLFYYYYDYGIFTIVNDYII